MFESVLQYIPAPFKQKARREIYNEVERFTAMSKREQLYHIRKELIRDRVDHIFSIGYTKKQVKDAIVNEFGISSSRAYRYIKEVRGGRET